MQARPHLGAPWQRNPIGKQVRLQILRQGRLIEFDAVLAQRPVGGMAER